jgi:hypothetical protein
MALTTRVNLNVVALLSSVLDLTTPKADVNNRTEIELTSGTGLGAADMVWSDRRTVAASATDTLDLAASLTGPLGGTLTFARVKLLLVKASSANTHNVVITRPAANGVPLFSAAGDALAVHPGGLNLWVAPSAAGVVVTAATGDLIDIVNSGAVSSVTYDIVIIGASA